MRATLRLLAALMVASMATAGLAASPALAAAVDAVDDGTALAPFQFFPEDGPATAVDVISNDLGFDGTTSIGLTITAKTNGAHGTVAIDAGLRFVTYHPNANDSGADSFTYTVTDGTTSDTATVYVSISAINDAPSFTLGANPVVRRGLGRAHRPRVRGRRQGGPGGVRADPDLRHRQRLERGPLLGRPGHLAGRRPHVHGCCERGRCRDDHRPCGRQRPERRR